MGDFQSKYSGEQVEEMLDQIANGEAGGGGGGITVETDPIFSASPAASITEEKKAEWDNKVDKVSGKQLSTEDFTSALKTKLEGLSNYDDTELSDALSTLRGDFDKLVSGDTTTAIKTFNEVIAFLDGVQDTQDLSSIIASIEQQIAGKQDKLISGTNIKTINGESIVGSGDLTIEGGAKVYEWFYDGESESVTLSQEEYDNIVEADIVIVNLGEMLSFTVSKTGKEFGEAFGEYNLTGQFDLQESTMRFTIRIEVSTKLATITMEQQNIPTKTSQLENDSNFVSSNDLKTINGQSIVGSGDIEISGGSPSGGSGKEYVEAPILEEPMGAVISFSALNKLEPNKVYVATSNEVTMLYIGEDVVLTTSSLCDEYTIMFKAGGDGGAVLALPTDWIMANELPKLTGYVEVNIVRTTYQGNNVFKVVVCEFKPVE